MNKKNIIIILIGVLLVSSILIYSIISNPNDVAIEDDNTEVNDDIDDNEGGSNVESTMAPDFTLRNLDGEEVKLSDYRGKLVLINFWATWCTYCDKEMPDLEKFYNENIDDLVILAVDVQEEEKDVRKYVEEKNLTFPILLDEDGRVASEYYVSAYPTTYFVGEDGRLLGRVPGMMTYAQMNDILKQIRGN